MKQSMGAKSFQVFNNIFMFFLCVVTLYPYLNQLAIAFNDGADTSFGGITVFPRKFSMENMRLVFQNELITNAAFISVTRVILGTLLALVVTTAAAYALSRNYLPGKNYILTFLIIPGYISVGLIPAFILYRTLHMSNTYWVYIIPKLFSFYNMLIIMSYFRGLPIELEESAIIDGANEVQVFFKITIPLSMPVLATVALWLSVEHWNDWVTTLLYVTDRNIYTLQYLLMQVVKESETLQSIISEVAVAGGNLNAVNAPTPDAVKAATFIIVTLPIICLYPFLQKYFVKGVVLGAVKG